MPEHPAAIAATRPREQSTVIREGATENRKPTQRNIGICLLKSPILSMAGDRSRRIFNQRAFVPGEQVDDDERHAGRKNPCETFRGVFTAEPREERV
jgi:hypothetical protein